ncbi:MAG TPA: methyltransferase [Roseiarcus sp.]|nr:methyltransferase [Roseiarcus sp.]
MAEDKSSATLETTSDSWLGGKLMLRQPAKGHRVGSDAALLAAAAPQADRIADIGAGIGAVGLALLSRMPKARADLVEIDAELAELARENAAANGFVERVRVAVADVTSAPFRRGAGLVDGAADLVVTNPPFFEAGRAQASPEARRARAHILKNAGGGEGAGLAAWLLGALALLAPGGCFVMIHRPEALGAILAAFENRLGAVALLPVHPRADAPAHRLLIAGVKGARAPLSLRPGLVLHEPSGAFTETAEKLHCGEAILPLLAR